MVGTKLPGPEKLEEKHFSLNIGKLWECYIQHTPLCVYILTTVKLVLVLDMNLSMSVCEFIEAGWRIYASINLAIFVSDNGLLPVRRRQAIFWISARLPLMFSFPWRQHRLLGGKWHSCEHVWLNFYLLLGVWEAECRSKCWCLQ